MRGAAVLAVVVLAALLAGVLVPQAAGVAAPATVNSGVTVTETSTVTKYAALTGNAYHNGTLSAGSNASTPISIPVNVTGYTSLAGLSALVTMSTGAYIPQVVAKQGSVVLFNSTVQPQFTVNPQPGTVPVVLSVFALYTLAGGQSPLGTYRIYANVSESATLTNALAEAWTLSGITFSLSYSATAPYGFYLNSTTVNFPFPSGVSVNYSSASAKGGRDTVSYGAVFVYNATLAPGATWTASVTFAPVPVTTGSAFVPLTKARRVPGSSTLWTSFGNYTNGLGLPYESLYVLEVSFAYPLDPTSVTVRAGSHTLNASTFSVSPSTVTILPGTLLVGAAATESFQVNFTSLAAPPLESLTPTSTLFVANGVSVSLADLIVASMILVFLYAGGVLSIHRRDGPQRRRTIFIDLIAAESALAAFWIVATVLAAAGA